jgi:trehalose-phosphatase
VSAVSRQPPERPLRDVPDALEAFDDLTRRIGEKRVAILLDFDGTLAPIVERPEDARISTKMRAALERLGHDCLVAVVSGRALDDVRSRVPVDDLWFAGSHGFEIRDDQGHDRSPDLGADHRERIAGVGAELEKRLAHLEGVQVERKPFAVAVHYRRASSDAAEHAQHAARTAAEADDALRSTTGKMIVEVRPGVDWDKGSAVRTILDRARLDPDSSIPIYIGDDDTDKDGFRGAQSKRGLGVAVGDRFETTSAAFRLDDTEDVRTLLERLADLLERRPRGDGSAP